jgi:hypothetical protein
MRALRLCVDLLKRSSDAAPAPTLPVRLALTCLARVCLAGCSILHACALRAFLRRAALLRGAVPTVCLLPFLRPRRCRLAEGAGSSVSELASWGHWHHDG